MATTVHERPRAKKPELNDSGGGGWRNLVPAAGNLRSVQERPSPPVSTGIWVGLCAITMTFAALTSALIVRKGGSLDWQHLTLPPILYLNTLILFASSVTLEISRHRIATFMSSGKQESDRPRFWLLTTLFLGVMFVTGQYAAWRQLRSEGLYLATNPSSSFFYLLTAAHALHILGGLGGLIRVIRKFGDSVLRRSTLDATARYWHFMDILWVYLLLLLWTKL